MEVSTSLSGSWRLYYHLEEGDEPRSLNDVKQRNWPMIEAQVPGNVELDLVRAGLEEDPFYGENLYNFRKYEFYQWWYERTFTAPTLQAGEKAILNLHGVDTLATIWINDIEVGQSANAMISHAFDISPYLQQGEDVTNHIAIRLQSAINYARRMPYPVAANGAEHSDELVWLRKPPHAFGWDIAPRLVSAGLWKDVEIVIQKPTRITQVYYATHRVSEKSASLAVRFRFETDAPILDGYTCKITGQCGEHCFEQEKPLRFVSDSMMLEIPDPQLWWPRHYGEQHLYEVTCELLYQGVTVDQRTERIGLRTITFDTHFVSGDEGRFQIIVNGCPIMAKGTNWVPLDAMHSRDASRLSTAVAMLADLGCNIVRCWGGNVYEDHAFFDYCDEHGIMVWQDFSMACAIYPQQDEFRQMIEQEATFIIGKLRNHASLALWAGDNEIDQMYYHRGYLLDHARYNHISREWLPRIVGEHDPFRRFLPSSPFIPEHIEGDLAVPEQHNWGPRDYFKGDFYKHSSAHFISEIGYHGCPAVASLERFIAPEHRWPYQNAHWDTHNTDYIRLTQRGYNRNQLMADQVEILFGAVPDTLEDFALASQISQAEAKKFFIESVRLKKWRRTGLIWWNLLDCWPQISDAVVDYYFSKKMAYHYIKRVQQPVTLMMAELENWHHAVVLANDSRSEGWVDYTVEDGDSGEVVLSGRAYARANENVEVGHIHSLAGRQRLYLLRWTYEGQQGGNHYVSGYIPLDLGRYQTWLTKIEALPQGFDAMTCVRGIRVETLQE